MNRVPDILRQIKATFNQNVAQLPTILPDAISIHLLPALLSFQGGLVFAATLLAAVIFANRMIKEVRDLFVSLQELGSIFCKGRRSIVELEAKLKHSNKRLLVKSDENLHLRLTLNVLQYDYDTLRKSEEEELEKHLLRQADYKALELQVELDRSEIERLKDTIRIYTNQGTDLQSENCQFDKENRKLESQNGDLKKEIEQYKSSFIMMQGKITDLYREIAMLKLNNRRRRA